MSSEICKLSFDKKSEKTPIVFSCLHKFCSDCLEYNGKNLNKTCPKFMINPIWNQANAKIRDK